MIIITPVLRKLKEEGCHVILHTGKRGREINKNSPYVDEYLDHQEDVPITDFHRYMEDLKKNTPHDRYISFTESIECNVALHPIGPRYIYPRKEREVHCNRNYYDVTMAWAGYKDKGVLPEMFFTPQEEMEALQHVDRKEFTILWSMSGSGMQKVYPWSDYVMGQILKDYPDVNIITVGDEKCQLLESLLDKKIKNLAGRIGIRQAMCLTKMVNLVIAPDTGLLHASACYSTPKIGLLGHTTVENITKYFKNDYSLEAKCACGPCFRLIYDHSIQCPIDCVTGAAWCMSEGIPPMVLYERFQKVYSEHYKGRDDLF